MRWASFLHIYQPSDQQPDILEMIVKQSYAPIIKHTLSSKNCRYTLNINGALLELFDKYGYHDLINGLAEAGKQGKIEFTGSAKFHALLPLLPPKEALRQLQINNQTLSHYLGAAFKPRGVFLPEMAFSPEIVPILEKAGFEWVLLDEIAMNGKTEMVNYNHTYKIKDSSLTAFFRERRTSNVIMSAAVRDIGQLKQSLVDELNSDRYVLTGMDGETFGHHRPGLENLLFEIFDAPEFNMTTISELPKLYQQTEEISPITCTWASSEQDIEDGIQFISWKDPSNEIHHLQWQLRDFALEQFYKLPKDNPHWQSLREQMDRAMASDQFYWASAKPWWSFEWIEGGAWALVNVLRHLPGISPEALRKSEDLYHKIVETAFDWKRNGKLLNIEYERKEILRIPFKERTLETGGEGVGVYHAFLDIMREQEKAAAGRQEYEAAAMWRDAIYKLEFKTDIYDFIHVVDLLRIKLPGDYVDGIVAKYKRAYLKTRGGQPEQRDR